MRSTKHAVPIPQRY